MGIKYSNTRFLDDLPTNAVVFVDAMANGAYATNDAMLAVAKMFPFIALQYRKLCYAGNFNPGDIMFIVDPPTKTKFLIACTGYSSFGQYKGTDYSAEIRTINSIVDVFEYLNQGDILVSHFPNKERKVWKAIEAQAKELAEDFSWHIRTKV